MGFTESELKLNGEEVPNFIFTSELQGCHLNVRIDESGIKVHHSRRGLAEDEKKEYSDFLGPEEYTNASNDTKKFFPVTAFLYRDPKSNEWYFVYQKIDYFSQYPTNNEEYVEKFTIKAGNVRPIKKINGSGEASSTSNNNMEESQVASDNQSQDTGIHRSLQKRTMGQK